MCFVYIQPLWLQISNKTLHYIYSEYPLDILGILPTGYYKDNVCKVWEQKCENE